MTPSARLQSTILLITEIDLAPRRPADAVANDFFRERRYIGSADRRAVSDLAWKILRSWRRLSWWLAHAGLEDLPAHRVALTLLFEGWTMDGVLQSYSGGQYAPPRLAPAAAARLRSLEGATLLHPEMPDATRLELPEWLLPRLQARFGAALTHEMQAAEREATLDLRVNLLKATREEALAALRAEGLDVVPTKFSPWGLRIKGRRPVTSGPAFRAGLVEIQDEGSQLLAALVNAGPNMRVADYCAGAGGKTLAIAMTMANHGHIVACDVSAPRLEASAKRLRRAGVHNVETHLLAPGDKWAKRRAQSFDRVLVDAPCTGTGTWRRNPDARIRLTEQDLAELLSKQAHILQAASALVKPGGRLIYATCSLLPEENEAQVQDFLSRNPAFRPVEAPPLWPGAAPAATLSLTPLKHGTDGFFGAVMERVSPDLAAAAPEPGA
jgi:16S rRNA (cytosine967-C5)-methyltransferase